jgi:hypothetical protein
MGDMFKFLTIDYQSTEFERINIKLKIIHETKPIVINIDMLISKFIENILESIFEGFDPSGLNDVIQIGTDMTMTETTHETEAGQGRGAPPLSPAPPTPPPPAPPTPPPPRRSTRLAARGQNGGIGTVVQPIQNDNALLRKTRKSKKQVKTRKSSSDKKKSSQKTLKMKELKNKTHKQKPTHMPVYHIAEPEKRAYSKHTTFSNTRNHLSMFNVLPFVLPTIYAIPNHKHTPKFKQYIKFINLQLQQAYYELVVHYDIRSMSDPDMRELFYEEHMYHLHSAYYTAKPDLMMYKIFLHKLPVELPVFFMEYILSNIVDFTEDEEIIKTGRGIHYAIRYLRQYLQNTRIEYQELHDLIFTAEPLKKIFDRGQQKEIIKTILSILKTTRNVYLNTHKWTQKIDKTIPDTYKKMNIAYGLYMGSQEHKLGQLKSLSRKVIGRDEVEE